MSEHYTDAAVHAVRWGIFGKDDLSDPTARRITRVHLTHARSQGLSDEEGTRRILAVRYLPSVDYWRWIFIDDVTSCDCGEEIDHTASCAITRAAH